MSILYLLIPIAVLFLIIAVAFFFWAIGNAQYDDMDSPALKIVIDDHQQKNNSRPNHNSVNNYSDVDKLGSDDNENN